MIANYHTHTWRCNHAEGTEREYVERAIEGGLKILGFSDHTPYPFPDGYTSGFRMRVDQFENYVDTVLSLKKEYQNDIDICLGLEAEYYPAYFHDLQRLVSDYPLDYFLLGQHFIGNERGDVYSGAPTTDENGLKRYCDQVIEAMATGYFTYFAHPDLFHYMGPTEVYEKHMRTVCQAAARYQVPLEINFLGLLDHRHYPDLRFWQYAAQEGCVTVFGGDAHRAENVWAPQVLEKAQDLAKKYNLTVLETIPFRKPF